MYSVEVALPPTCQWTCAAEVHPTLPPVTVSSARLAAGHRGWKMLSLIEVGPECFIGGSYELPEPRAAVAYFWVCPGTW